MSKDFLQQKYPDLSKSPEVASAVRRREKRAGEKVKGDKKVETYLHRLEEIFSHPDESCRQRRIDILKDKLHDLFVIKPADVPEAYFDLQRKIAREQGHGDIEISPEMRKQATDAIITDQTQSLDAWIDYLGSEDAVYPAWLKYFAFRNIVKLGEYDKEKKEFKKRSKGTVGLFPDINREALAYVLDAIEKQYGRKERVIGDQEWEQLLKGANFAKLYAYAIERITPASQEQKEIIEGEWVKYDQSSDPTPLYTSLQGQGTGWCTAGESVAQAQLELGDFYVYYSKAQNGQNTIPRVAIRMQNNQIAEVRGINSQQNLEGKMMDIAEEKMRTLPGADAHKKKTADMRQLTELDKKVKAQEKLTPDDLRFLYEIESPIHGFGYQRDPRIEEIRQTRDIKADLALLFNTTEDKISLTQKEALKGDIVFHYGDLNLSSLTSAQGLELPENIGGYLNLNSLTSAQGLKLPENIGGGLYLSSLTSAQGLELPENIGGYLNLNSLTSAEKEKLRQQYPHLEIF